MSNLSPMQNAPKIDGRSLTSAENGKQGGCPEGSFHSDRRTYDPSELAQVAAERILAGKSLAPRSGPLTPDDRLTINRALGEPAETFQARISTKLEAMADETADLIFAKLRDTTGKPGVDTFRPDTLPSLLAITIDKLQALSGRATSIGSVNVQINHIASDSRPAVLGNLRSLRGDRSAPTQDAIAV